MDCRGRQGVVSKRNEGDPGDANWAGTRTRAVFRAHCHGGRWAGDTALRRQRPDTAAQKGKQLSRLCSKLL